jgi:hypothetical protein
MRILLVLTVTLSIIIGIMMAPALLVSWACIAAGLSKGVMVALVIPACVVGTLLGMAIIAVIVDSEKFDKLLGF